MRNHTVSQQDFKNPSENLDNPVSKDFTVAESAKKLSSYLLKEISIYRKILSLEQEKSKAIHDTNASQLKLISEQQQSLVVEAESLEFLRETILQLLNRASNNSFSTISEIIQSNLFNENQVSNLTSASQDLKDIMLALKSIVNQNHEQLKLNQELFQELIGELSMKRNDGYSDPGVKTKNSESASRAMFIDING